MLTWEYPPVVSGGLGVACAGLAEALRENVDVSVILPDEGCDDPYASGFEEETQARVRAYGETVRRDAADAALVHAHDWMSWPAAAAWSRETGRPWVAHVHSLEVDRSGACGLEWIRDIEREGLQSADVVVAVSHVTAGRITGEYGVAGDKIRVVPNGIRMAKPWRIRDRELRVTFIGRITWQKAPDDFVEIAAKVAERYPKVEFTMAGRGEMLDALKERVEELELTGRFEFPGFLGRPAIDALLARTDVLCMPSRAEPFGLVALEAACFRVPAVISETAGVAEVLPSAQLAPPGDVGKFAWLIGELLAYEAMRHELGHRAQIEASWMTWEGAAETLLMIYASLPR